MSDLSTRVRLRREQLGLSQQELARRMDMSKEEQIAHKLEHNVLGEIIRDCQVVLVKKACKNTAKVFQECGIKICKVELDCQNAKDSFKYLK